MGSGIRVAGTTLVLGLVGMFFYARAHDAIIRKRIAFAVEESARDPHIRLLARAIAVVATMNGHTDELEAVGALEMATACWIQYDLKYSGIPSTESMQEQAMTRHEKIWRGDCKTQAVFMGALLKCLNMPFVIKAEHKFPNPVGHAWIEWQGYDLNPGEGWRTTPLPHIVPLNMGAPGMPQFNAQMLIHNQPGAETRFHD